MLDNTKAIHRAAFARMLGGWTNCKPTGTLTPAGNRAPTWYGLFVSELGNFWFVK